MTNPAVRELLERSNRLGADPRNTNYAGGNTSAKGSETDPVTGEPAELLWVKGSGGDLGTLTEKGLAVLRLDRLRALTGVYPGVERGDEMVAAFDFCLHGRVASSGWTSLPCRGRTRRRSAWSWAGTASPRGARPAPSARRTPARSSRPRRPISSRMAGKTRSGRPRTPRCPTAKSAPPSSF